MIVIIEEDERLISQLPDEAVDLLIFIREEGPVNTWEELHDVAWDKLKMGGELITAASLPDAFTQL